MSVGGEYLRIKTANYKVAPRGGFGVIIIPTGGNRAIIHAKPRLTWPSLYHLFYSFCESISILRVAFQRVPRLNCIASSYALKARQNTFLEKFNPAVLIMQESLLGQEAIAQDPHSSSLSPNDANQAPLQPPSSEISRAEGVLPADSKGEQTTPTSSDQDTSAQIDSSATLMGNISRLPKAVVIPQRRPSDRARGFVRAYAPDLLRCDIDQATFLRFIDGLNKSVACNAAVDAVGLAGEAVGAVPGSEFVGAPIIGTALQVAAGAYKEVNARKGYVFSRSSS